MPRYASKTNHLHILTLRFGGISCSKSFHRNILAVAFLPGGHSVSLSLYHAISATMTRFRVHSSVAHKFVSFSQEVKSCCSYSYICQSYRRVD